MFTFLTYHGNDADISNLRQEIDQNIGRHRVWYIFEGISFLVIGILALALPNITALTVEILIAALLIITGITQSLLFFKRRERWLRLVSGFLSISAGGIMLAFPAAGLVVLTIIVGLFLIFEGVTEIGMAFILRPFFSWWWLLISGSLALLLGILIFAFLPVMGMIYIAIAIGLNMILYGVSLLVLSWKASKQPVNADV